MNTLMKLAAAAAVLGAGGLAQAQVVFTDNFAGAPSPLWANQRGNWTVANGVYFAQEPNHQPPTYTSLPQVLGDLDVEMDINGVNDGGVWLHADDTGANGVLLVTGGFLHTGTGFYWHEVVNGNYGPVLGNVNSLFTQGQNIHIRVTVRGTTYSVYMNNSSTPASTIDSSLFPTGRLGLYDFAVEQQTFDNVVLRKFCSADIASAGNPDPQAGGDDFITGDDFDLFVQAFFTGLRRTSDNTLIADLTNGPGTGGPDGFLTGSDFDKFVELFFSGC